MEPVPAGPVRDGLEGIGADLATTLDRVRALCLRAQEEAPSAGLEVPRGPDGTHPELHRAVSRWAGAVAQASWSVTLAAVAEDAGDRHEALRQVGTARRAVELADAHLPGA